MTRNIFLILAVSVGIVISAGNLRAEDERWTEDFEAAKATAAKMELPILAFFTGSDWCGWCKKLESEVLSKSKFKDFADKKFVLFKADFPQRKKQSDEVASQNSKLSTKYKIRGFPTLLILSADGQIIAQTGYRRGGAEKYIDHLKDLMP